MSYAPPAYNAANVTWQDAAEYTPPAYNVADVTWQNLSQVSVGTITVTGLQPTVKTQLDDVVYIGAITVEGLLPSIEMGVSPTAFIGEIAFTGETPTVLTEGVLLYAGMGDLSISGQLASCIIGQRMMAGQATLWFMSDPAIYIDRITLPIPAAWVSTRYRCTLGDLLLPISSFQTRLRKDGISILSCVLKGADAYAEEIDARSGQRLTIIRDYVLSDGSVESFFMAAGNFERMDLQTGGRSGVTATLSASGNFEPETTETIALTDVTYYARQDGIRRYRCAINPNLRPGDSAQVNGDTITVGEIIHIVDIQMALMEIAEA